jgi:hypothetical protein
MADATTNETHVVPGRRLGKLPAKADPRDLHLRRFLVPKKALPARTNFWPRRATFPLRTFGNLLYGCCTIASQAVMQMRMERLETRRTPSITDEAVIEVYKSMSERLYGGGDNGAYELDALRNWRDPELTFTDTKGRALTIDAFLRIEHTDMLAIREALVTAKAHGIKVCFNLPWAFSNIVPPDPWDIPEGQALTGDWMPGSWGGHALGAYDFDTKGVWIEHTWNLPRQLVTWRAFAAYCDEAYVVIDSFDTWRNKSPKALDYPGIKKAVNAVSRTKIQ